MSENNETNRLAIKTERYIAGAQLPAKSRPRDACYDLRAAHDAVIPPGRVVAVSTGLKIEVPDGYCLDIRPRSGLALNHSITVLNSPGTVDSTYRGEVKVILANISPLMRYDVKAGDKIAQCKLTREIAISFEEVEHVRDNDERGGHGFGSSGR